MTAKRFSKNRLVKTIFGCLFAIISLFQLAVPTDVVYADPVDEPVSAEVEVDTNNVEEAANEEVIDEEETEDENAEVEEKPENAQVVGASCEDNLGELGWWVCPQTGKIAKAVDWLYDKIESVLVINPIEAKDGTPIYEIWKYAKGITNIVFIMFFLVVIYSQLTGVGISNYGIKKVLPKLIVVAILVNLSFIICSLAVDISNILGNSLRGVFTSIEEATLTTINVDGGMYVSMSEMYAALASGTALSIGAAVVAFEMGAIWMLIPVVLGAIVAVVSGLITIALRQAVVTILIMISPLAFVAYMLPNTEQWFKKWKQLFTKMLVFYPAFSLLFGASSLAGWAIMASAKDGFGLLLGVAIQIFPLFFSWSLMKMSGTFLSDINAKLQSLAAKPLATNRAWAESRREATKQRLLASKDAYTPSLRLRQFLSDRKIAREEETRERAETVKNRGLAYGANKNYYKNGVPSKEGEEAYEMQARNLRYQRVLLRHANNMSKGLGALEIVKENATKEQLDRLTALDMANIQAADLLKLEKARTEKVDEGNAKGFHNRMEKAMNAHFDEINWDKSDYRRHFDSKTSSEYKNALQAYDAVNKLMEGDLANTQYGAAYAAHAYDTQAKIVATKMQKYFEILPPTRDVRYRLEELVKAADESARRGKPIDLKAADNIDAIIPGLRVLIQRGDTDFAKEILDDILDEKYGGLKLGTHASQAIASFLLFDVKDSDPYMRRFGKYINLETARMFDKNKRQKETVDYEEYVKGYHIEPNGEVMYAKKDMVRLMGGTSLDGIERTALDNYDKSLRKAYTDENGVLDNEAYEKKKREVDAATAPQFISANLKFLSGSEQIVSAVKNKTGYFAKQDPATGKYTMVPIWDDEEQAKELFGAAYSDPHERAKAKKEKKKFYRNQTLQYLRDQTPTQILGLRSDYYVPLVEHLSDAYLCDDDGEEIPERVRERLAQENEIKARHGGSLDSVGAKAELFNLKKKDAGEMFRELLYRKGKLRQLEKTKRSGAANSAKDWVRELLLLDTDYGLNSWILQRESDSGMGGSFSGGNVGGGGGGRPPRGGGPAGGGRRPPRGGGGPAGGSGSSVGGGQQGSTDDEEVMRILEEVEQMVQQQADAPVVEGDGSLASMYGPEDVAFYENALEVLKYTLRDEGYDGSTREGVQAFFDASCAMINRYLGEGNIVAVDYRAYYDARSKTCDIEDLMTALKVSLEKHLLGGSS